MSEVVKGMPTGLYVSDPLPYGQDAGAIPSIRLDVSEYRPAGSSTLPVRLTTGQGASSFKITTGAIITVATVSFEVATDATLTTGTTVELSVTPLPLSLSNGSVLWAARESLHRVHGTSDTDVEITTTTQDATDVISGSAWNVPVITSRSWRLPRRGRFRPNDPAYQAVRRAALEDDLQVAVRRVLANEAGQPAQTEGGMAIITNFNTPAPADGIVDATWVFQGVGPLTEGSGRVEPEPTGVMLDFRDGGNAINLGFI